VCQLTRVRGRFGAFLGGLGFLSGLLLLLAIDRALLLRGAGLLLLGFFFPLLVLVLRGRVLLLAAVLVGLGLFALAARHRLFLGGLWRQLVAVRVLEDAQEKIVVHVD
jgi:hypothetical protein